MEQQKPTESETVTIEEVCGDDYSDDDGKFCYGLTN